MGDVCRQLDTDNSGHLTVDELMAGFYHNSHFHLVCQHMDMTIDDFEIIFALLDEDGNGSIDYAEFVEQLYKLKEEDSHTLLVFIKHYVRDIKQKQLHEMEYMHESFTSQMQQMVNM